MRIVTESEFVWRFRRFLVALPWVESVRLLRPWLSENLYLKADNDAYYSPAAKKYRRESKWRVI